MAHQDAVNQPLAEPEASVIIPVARPLPPIDPRYFSYPNMMQNFYDIVRFTILDHFDGVEIRDEAIILAGTGNSGAQVFKFYWRDLEPDEDDEEAATEGWIACKIIYWDIQHTPFPPEVVAENHRVAASDQYHIIDGIPAHPSIVNRLNMERDKSQEPRRLCRIIVMDYIDGHSLDAWIQTQGLPLGAYKILMEQIIAGVAHLHEHNVVHNGIEPTNIMVTHDLRRAVIVDLEDVVQVDEETPAELMPTEMLELGRMILQARVGIRRLADAEAQAPSDLSLQDLAKLLIPQATRLDVALVELLTDDVAARPTAQAFLERWQELIRD